MSTGSKSSGSKVEKVEEKARQKESWERPHPTENSGCGLQDRADEQRGQLVAELVVLLVLFFDAWKFGGGPRNALIGAGKKPRLPETLEHAGT